MVCEKCQKKLARVGSSDPFKSTARNASAEDGGRKVNENKALSSRKMRGSPYQTSFTKCKVCRTSVHQTGSNYCQQCAYKLAICAMCGVKMMNTKGYRMSSV